MAGFSIATLVVLVAAGAFVYWRVAYALDRALDSDLTQAAQTLDPLIGPSGKISDRHAASATGVAWQVVDADGAVLDHGGPAGTRPLITGIQLADIGDNVPWTHNVGKLLPASADPYRIQVSPAPGSADLYLVVGLRTDHRNEALRELLVQFALAGVATLVITAFVGDRLARAALRPVEEYRRQAAAIAAGDTDLRLDVPPERDDEVTRLGHTFNDMLAALGRALDRERQFVNEASHELRTPITLLTTRAQIARLRPRTQAEYEEFLDELEVDLDRLAQLTEQLLRMGAASIPAERRSSDLASVATRVIDERRRGDPEQAGAIAIAITAEPQRVPLTDLECERIITNLLNNAATHGAAPFRVAVDAPEPGWARLQIADEGPGMPPDLLERATERFARSDDARARPGFGLGLAMVSALVGSAGGEIRLCYGGHHASHGAPAPVLCEHGDAMNVSVLLPVAEHGTPG